jgi:hypothetical protein
MAAKKDDRCTTIQVDGNVLAYEIEKILDFGRVSPTDILKAFCEPYLRNGLLQKKSH